jgi:hypothetical protein
MRKRILKKDNQRPWRSSLGSWFEPALLLTPEHKLTPDALARPS